MPRRVVGVTDAFIKETQAAYAFEGAALELGALVVGNEAKPDAKIRMPLSMLNRHGLVAGATGTGKTKTLQLMAEQLSANGVPCFLADIKGDVSGMAAPGQPSDRIAQRSTDVGDDWQAQGFPVEFLSIGGVGTGAAVRATMTSFGPRLLAKVLGLNDVQASSLGLIFHFADQNGLPLLDLKDLRAVIQFLTSDEGKQALEGLGGLSSATAGVILRDLIALEDQGADVFFGEPEFDTDDLLRVTPDGKGVVSVMELQGLQDRPAVFSTFLMWLLADLFHDLPEVGDLDKPKLVFFFDEAHLLFDDASKGFLDEVAQTVRLIRSKGVGVFFVTQTPKDVPADVLAQLGNRIQHALRAFTPDDAKALKATVGTFPKSDAYDLEELLTQLGIGEAVVTILSERGAPTPVAWTRMRAPRSLMAQLDPAQQKSLVGASPIAGRYATAVDRDSAYERLAARLKDAPREEEPKHEERHAGHAKAVATAGGAVGAVLGSTVGKSLLRSLGSALGREITRSIFGTAKRKKR
jgi:DNA helicase HerA-like ATPase